MSCINVSLTTASITPAISTQRAGVSAVFTLTTADGGNLILTTANVSESPQITAIGKVCACLTVSNIVERLSLIFSLASGTIGFALAKTCALGEFISCFGRGFWHNDYPWVNSEAWNNNNR